nr:MAG TPA: putative YnfE-like protein [Caudoviricetes sp.]
MQSSMSSLKKIMIYAFAIMVVVGVISKLVDTVKKQKAEIERLDRNIDAMNETEVQYISKLGDAAVKCKALELSVKELKKQNADLYNGVKALDVRLKDALSVSKVVTKTVIKEVVKTDTINGALIAEYRDPWNTIRAEQRGDSTELSYQGNDTIVGVISIRKKRFLFFRWGVKSVEYDVSNKNPKTKMKIDIAVKFK